MLVVISDLHFTDGTTSNWKGQTDQFNVNPKAFQLLFGTVCSLVRRRDTKIDKVTFVYNGDIFDPLRTYEWFAIAEAHRPWAVPLNKRQTCAHSHAILQKIVAHNDEALRWLSGTHADFTKVWEADAEITRVYVPGNHDRLVNLYTPSRKLVRERLLGEPSPAASAKFANQYSDTRHETVVMHGHEAHAYNCELDANNKPAYEAVPIGDPMTTMLFARLGYEMGEQPGIPAEAVARFRDLDNVRPQLAGLRYVQNIIADFHLGRKTDKLIKGVVDDFEQLPFYGQWRKQHDRWGSDEADDLQHVLLAIRLLGTYMPAGALERVAAFFTSDSYEKWARKTLQAGSNSNMRYCVLGHTHEPLHVPLCVDRARGVEQHYFNCGTFRTTFSSTFDGQHFSRSQRMAFVVIYGPGEFDKNLDSPAYEMWSGLRLEH